MKKLALCVGLNYPGSGNDLQGCVNDAMDWHDELVRRNFDEVQTLLEPTKVELVAALKALVAKARYRDRIVFTYSGHGTWVPDTNGDEADSRDESLVCKDFRQGGLLIDDELHQIFGEAKYGVRRLIISDSCFSGTVSRFVDLNQLEAKAQRRFLPPAEFLEPNSPQYDAAEQVEGLKATSVSRTGAALISGCGDFEYSYDASFSGRPNGAFTRAAIDTLNMASTLKGWHQAIRKLLPSPEYPQSPELTATAYQRYLSPL